MKRQVRMPRRPNRVRNLLAPLTKKDHADCVKENLEVHSERHVLDVGEVILNFLPHVVDALVVLMLHLRPAGDPWANLQPAFIEWDFSCKLFDEEGAFGTR